MNRLINVVLTGFEQGRGTLRRWLGRSPVSSKQPAAEGGRTLATLVILSWKRPGNVREILDAYTQYARVGEAIVWNNNRDETFHYAHDKVRCINSDEFGLDTRWLAARLARYSCIIVHDDDLVCDEETIDRLIDAHVSDPDRTYALHGRNPDAKNEYATFVDHVSAPVECDMHLTRVACTHRRFVGPYFDAVDELRFDTDPASGGGEDILFSFVVRKVTGNRPMIVPGRYKDLLAPHAIANRNGPQIRNRTQIMRRCQEWLARTSADR